MAKEVAFSLPKSEVLKITLKSGVTALIGFLVVLVAGYMPRINFMLIVIAAIVVMEIGIYMLVSRAKYVVLSDTHIKGATRSGKKHQLAWSSSISIKDTSLNGLRGIDIISDSGAGVVFIPLPIIQTNTFKELVNIHAPSNHPLRLLVSSCS